MAEFMNENRATYIPMKFYLGFVLLFLLSCVTPQLENSTNKFSYVKSRKTPTTFKSKKRIAIQTFKDLREKKNISYSGIELIPFIPYSTNAANKPDAYYKYQLSILPETDFAKGMAFELTDYQVFDKVFYTDRSFPKDADYIISGEIIKSQIYSKNTSYGVNTAILFVPYLSSLPYLIGMFIHTDFYTIRIEIKVEIINSKSKKIEMQKVFSKEFSDWEIGLDKYADKYADIGEKFILQNRSLIQEMSKEVIIHFEEGQK